MIIGTGIDLIKIERMGRMLARWGETFKQRIFTPGEVSYCDKKNNHAQHYAARFAVKEAVLKALGSGLVARMKWSDVEVSNEQSGKPNVILNGEVKRIAEARNISNIFVSIAHDHEYAVAHVIAEG